MGLVLQGMTAWEISKVYDVPVETVRRRMKSTYLALRVNNRVSAAIVYLCLEMLAERSVMQEEAEYLCYRE